MIPKYYVIFNMGSHALQANTMSYCVAKRIFMGVAAQQATTAIQKIIYREMRHCEASFMGFPRL